MSGPYIVDEFSIEEMSEEPALLDWQIVDGCNFIFELSERNLTVDERAKMMAAKVKELKSFFENQVWIFTDNHDPDRTMKARFVLTWRKDDDGRAEAKARLVIQGYNDPDALAGNLETNSPTGTRTARQFLLHEASVRHWDIESADVKTAFLQGAPKDRTLFVKLNAETARLIGIEDYPYMRLVKPMYGQTDAPREWFLEATRRLQNCGLIAHPLDPCFFMAFDSQNKLHGLIHLHVDDMLIAGNSSVFNSYKEQLKKSFSFRTWKQARDQSLTLLWWTHSTH